MVEQKRYYAGIGSRTTPRDILKLMQEFGYQAAERGLVLRSGHAPGADTAFETGCDQKDGDKQIFIPWKNFSGSKSQYYGDSCAQAYEMAKKIHPVYNRLSQAARKLVARNMHQIMGPDFNEPVEFVVCYTPDGCDSHTSYGRSTGGTGTAICFASMQAIPIYNFANKNKITEAFDLL